MAIRGARDVVRDVVDEGSLAAFEIQCKTADELLGVLERTDDPEEAYGMAVAWASATLSIARVECALLSSVYPEYLADMEEINEAVKVLVQRRVEAEDAVYELRGSPTDVTPLNVKVDPVMARARAEAKENRTKVYAETLAELAPLEKQREPIGLIIGKIDRTLRALYHFADTRFPVPTRRGRSPMSSAIEDKRADPLAAFAETYVANMGKRDKERAALEAARARAQAADARPARDWEKLHKEDLTRRAEHIS